MRNYDLSAGEHPQVSWKRVGEALQAIESAMPEHTTITEAAIAFNGYVIRQTTLNLAKERSGE